MTVEKYCTRCVDTALPTDTVQTAAQRMHARNVGTLVVVNPQHEPIGIVTDRDLALRVLSLGGDPLRIKVGDVMTRDPRTVQEDVEIEETLRFMRSGPFRRMPVVDDAGRLVGLISLDDILHSLATEFRGVDRLLQHESPEVLAETVPVL